MAGRSAGGTLGGANTQSLVLSAKDPRQRAAMPELKIAAADCVVRLSFGFLAGDVGAHAFA